MGARCSLPKCTAKARRKIAPRARKVWKHAPAALPTPDGRQPRVTRHSMQGRAAEATGSRRRASVVAAARAKKSSRATRGSREKLGPVLLLLGAAAACATLSGAAGAAACACAFLSWSIVVALSALQLVRTATRPTRPARRSTWRARSLSAMAFKRRSYWPWRAVGLLLFSTDLRCAAPGFRTRLRGPRRATNASSALRLVQPGAA